jgi:D-alanine-D-alanine ligase
VKKIKNREELVDFIKTIFRSGEEVPSELAHKLDLKPNEEFPQKEYFVVEEMVSQGNADHFMEITGGMLTYFDADNNICYEVFEPSEALAQKGILSLEEKFLAGEGQNITPARFAPTVYGSKSVSAQVRETLERAARILNIEGYSRIDAFVRTYKDGHAEVIFIEVNSLPGLTPATCIFHQAAINGYKPFEFLDHIIQYGFQKEKQREYNTAS